MRRAAGTALYVLAAIVALGTVAGVLVTVAGLVVGMATGLGGPLDLLLGAAFALVVLGLGLSGALAWGARKLRMQ